MGNHHLVYEELAKALNGEHYELPLAEEALRPVQLIEQIQHAIR